MYSECFSVCRFKINISKTLVEEKRLYLKKLKEAHMHNKEKIRKKWKEFVKENSSAFFEK